MAGMPTCCGANRNIHSLTLVATSTSIVVATSVSEWMYVPKTFSGLK